jgi:uncharacterized protein (TIGR03435 family)
MASRQAFEAASIKPYVPAGRGGPPLGGPGAIGGLLHPTTVRYSGFELKYLLMLAYGVQRYQIIGPAWLDSERYEVDAKAPPGTTKEQLRTMLQTLFVERFQITLHRETKVGPIYELLVGRKGAKIKETGDDPGPATAPSSWPPPIVIGKDGCPQPARVGGITTVFCGPGRVRITSVSQSLSEFAKFLGLQLGRQVTDQTGLPWKVRVQFGLYASSRSDA